ncbi:MAG TPA: ubiquinol-cytochrome C chaperone family protein [Stellaceae bacterium]|nr:ubiquinol-cytochrome C chaperone family protein [Stellaceae bacterium]
MELAYAAIVEQARAPLFFAALGVPDTLDGRFETLALHAFLVLHRLKADRPASAEFAQALYDRLFADMDRSLREMGVADLGVGRRVKAMAEAFMGRVRAYEQGLEQGEGALAAALRRNLYGTVAAPGEEAVAAMGRYLRRQRAVLAAQPAAALLAGELRFEATETAVAPEATG